MKMRICVPAVAFASAVLAANSPQSPVSSRKLSNGLYELTVTVQGSPTDFFAVLVREAKKICGGQPLKFGHYKFNSIGSISNGNGSPGTSHLTLKQELMCGASEFTQTTPHTSYEWSPAEADNELVALRTQEYLAEKDKGELSLAYEQFSDAMKDAARFESWSKSVEDFNARAGGVEFRKIQKVSWVKDPPGVDPGFYAAVDYAGRFQNIPFECGYVAWYRDLSGRLSIVREEEGMIDRESQARMTTAELRNTLMKIGCAGN